MRFFCLNKNTEQSMFAVSLTLTWAHHCITFAFAALDGLARPDVALK